MQYWSKKIRFDFHYLLQRQIDIFYNRYIENYQNVGNNECFLVKK